MTKIKFCGITEPEDLISAVDAGCDWLGLNFIPASKRFVTRTKAEKILSAKPDEVAAIAVFANCEQSEIQETVAGLPISCLQFHGQELPTWCEQFELPYIKSMSIDQLEKDHNLIETYAEAEAILIDSTVDGKFGGTGVSFDWSLWPKNSVTPLILAGGLRPETVAEAIRVCQPYAVDVASGIENYEGRKDPELMRKFVAEVKSVG